jgi:hypothetical protein
VRDIFIEKVIEKLRNNKSIENIHMSSLGRVKGFMIDTNQEY